MLSLLASWLELHFLLNPGENEYIFGAWEYTDHKKIKASAVYYLKKIINDEEFVHALLEALGSHSLRKLAVTIARGNACSKDDVDHRGRWKGKKRQQDTYADTTIPCTDAKVAAALCRGGPVEYVIKKESGITDQWVLDYVVPSMRAAKWEGTEMVPNQACIVLEGHSCGKYSIPLERRELPQKSGPGCCTRTLTLVTITHWRAETIQ